MSSTKSLVILKGEEAGSCSSEKLFRAKTRSELRRGPVAQW